MNAPAACVTMAVRVKREATLSDVTAPIHTPGGFATLVCTFVFCPELSRPQIHHLDEFFSLVKDDSYLANKFIFIYK